MKLSAAHPLTGKLVTLTAAQARVLVRLLLSGPLTIEGTRGCYTTTACVLRRLRLVSGFGRLSVTDGGRALLPVGLDLARCEDLRPGFGCVETEAQRGVSKGWLCRWTGGAADFDGIAREFIRPDYESLSRAGNGCRQYHLTSLQDGIYEADSVWRSMKSHRSYFRVEGHSVVEIYESKTDALRALQGRAAA